MNLLCWVRNVISRVTLLVLGCHKIYSTIDRELKLHEGFVKQYILYRLPVLIWKAEKEILKRQWRLSWFELNHYKI